MFAACQIGDLRLNLIALGAQGFELIVMTGRRLLQLVPLSGDALQRAFHHGGHLACIISHILQMGGLITPTLVQRFDTGATFNGFLGIIAQQPGLSGQGLPLATGFSPCNLRGDLMLTGQVQVTFQCALAFVKLIEIGMLVSGLLRRFQSAVEIIELQLMFVTILLRVRDFLVQLFKLTRERRNPILGGFQRLFRLLSLESDFRALGGFLIDQTGGLVTLGFGLAHLLGQFIGLDTKLLDLGQRLVPAGGKRQVGLGNR